MKNTFLKFIFILSLVQGTSSFTYGLGSDFEPKKTPLEIRMINPIKTHSEDVLYGKEIKNAIDEIVAYKKKNAENCSPNLPKVGGMAIQKGIGIRGKRLTDQCAFDIELINKDFNEQNDVLVKVYMFGCIFEVREDVAPKSSKDKVNAPTFRKHTDLSKTTSKPILLATFEKKFNTFPGLGTERLNVGDHTLNSILVDYKDLALTDYSTILAASEIYGAIAEVSVSGVIIDWKTTGEKGLVELYTGTIRKLNQVNPSVALVLSQNIIKSPEIDKLREELRIILKQFFDDHTTIQKKYNISTASGPEPEKSDLFLIQDLALSDARMLKSQIESKISEATKGIDRVTNEDHNTLRLKLKQILLDYYKSHKSIQNDFDISIIIGAEPEKSKLCDISDLTLTDARELKKQIEKIITSASNEPRTK